jgi:tetratricopeptide (TPR) repeat protein
MAAALRAPKEPPREAAPGARARGGAPPEGVRRPFESRPVSAFSVDRKTYDLLRQARALREGGRYEEAVALYRQVVARRGGYFAPANLELSFSLLNLKRPSEAAETLEAITSRDGARYPVAFFHLGRIYEQAGQLARARAAYTRATALYGEGSPQVLLDLARVREREGDAAGAAESVEAYIRATARLGSGSDWAQAYLARLRRKPSSPAPRPK